MSSTAKEIAAGGLAGAVSTLCVHPLDTIRTRLQTSTRFSSALECATRTFVDESIFAFYKGLSFPLAAQVLYKAVIFTVSGTTMSVLQRGGREKRGWHSLVAGAVGGGTNALVVTPVELVRNRLMLQYSAADMRYRGPLDCVRQVVAAEGVRGMWRGLSATMLRDVPGVAAWYTGFSLSLDGFRSRAQRQAAASGADPSSATPGAAGRLLSGAVGGVSFWTVALPFDAIKSVVQTDLENRFRGSFVRAARGLWAEGGLQRLYRGWFVACGRGIPGAAITFSVYSYAREAMG